MPKKIIIIGGGIAGLSAGCYGRMNGYETDIFEMHTVPGGVCTGWKRKGYLFDGCLHWLTGTGPGNPFYKVWDELGALEGKRIINHEEFGRIILKSGRVLSQYSDITRLTEHLKAEFPGDAEAIETMKHDVQEFCKLSMPLRSAKAVSLWRKIRGFVKFLPYLPLFRRYSCNLETFALQFKDLDLREFITSLIPLPDCPAVGLLNILALEHKKEGGWPEGGSLELARSIEKRFLGLGGTIHYGARVKEIIVQAGKAAGVRLGNGAEHHADEVIGAADGRSTIFGMLQGRYVDEQIKNDYETMPLYTPLVQVSFGVKRAMGGWPRLTTCCGPFKAGRTAADWVWLNNYAFDASLAPPGKSAVTVLFQSPFEIWEKLAGDRQAYVAEKEKILADVKDWLEKKIPGIGNDIETSDVATPLTTVRYTGNHRGSFEGWRPTVKTIRKQLARRLPGLDNFIMIGQWTAGFHGLPSVAADGRLAIEELCQKHGKSFRTTTLRDERQPGAPRSYDALERAAA